MQRERALRPVQFDGGAQTGGHAIDQQFAVLPEKDVPVPEIERQHGVSLPEPGPQPQPGIPDVGENLRFAVVERHRTMTQRDVPDGDFTDGPHGIRRCIRRRAGRKRVGGGEDVPVRTPRPVPEGIDVGTVQREFQYVDFPVSQVADRIEDQHGLAERKQRVGPLPERIAECRRNQRAVRQFHAEPRKGGEKGQLHAAHPQPGVQTPVGDPLHDGRQLRGRENEIQHDSRADEQQQQHASRRNGAYPDDSLRATVHWQILLFFSKDNDFSETSHRTPGHIPGRPPLGTVRNRHAASPPRCGGRLRETNRPGGRAADAPRQGRRRMQKIQDRQRKALQTSVFAGFPCGEYEIRTLPILSYISIHYQIASLEVHRIGHSRYASFFPRQHLVVTNIRIFRKKVSFFLGGGREKRHRIGADCVVFSSCPFLPKTGTSCRYFSAAVSGSFPACPAVLRDTKPILAPRTRSSVGKLPTFFLRSGSHP